MKVKFCGAAKRVTGSCFYIEAANRKFLVDCGMFQGKSEELNVEKFPFYVPDLDFVILTHAHIDHTGRLPILIKDGFNGRIFCTSATSELVDVMLRDSGHIQEIETIWRNKKRLRKGLELLTPLYTYEDASKVRDYLESVSYDIPLTIDDDISITLRDAGHLLGSALVEINVKENGENKKLVFTGDLGNVDIPIIRKSEYIESVDYLFIESTYGNRNHEAVDDKEELCNIIENVTRQGGNVVIPSFAVGRTQEILYLLNNYIDIENKKELKKVEIYLDSPLAQEATKIFEKHIECYNDAALNVLSTDHTPLEFCNLHMTSTAEESMSLNDKKGIVIISSSGMCEAGRIKHHLIHNLWKKQCAVVFVGYQAEGTLGRKIVDGEKLVKIYGEEIAVKAKIHKIHCLSGHADQKGLLKWVSNIKNGINKKIIIIHGDEEASESLKDELSKITSTECIIPDLYETIKL